MSVPLIVSIIVFATMVSALFAIYTLAEARRGAKTLRARVAGEAKGEEVESGGVEAGFEYLRNQVGGLVGRLGTMTQPKSKKEVSALRRQLLTAGFRTESAAMTFLGAKLLLAVLLPVIALLLPIPALDGMAPIQQLLVYVGLGVAGLYAPQIWLGQVIRVRQRTISDGFPDALDLLVVCVEAGLGLDAAIGRASTELVLAHPVLAEEFRVMGLELRAGLPRDHCLRNLGDRIDLEAVRSFCALLIQTDRFGTSVAQALRVYSDSMRTERQQRAEEQAAKLPVKLLFPLMLFIFPSLFIVILGPAIIQGAKTLLPALSGTR